MWRLSVRPAASRAAPAAASIPRTADASASIRRSRPRARGSRRHLTCRTGGAVTGPLIDDADDTRVSRYFHRMPREARFLAADEEHLFANSSANRIHGHKRPADVRAVGVDRLDEQQLDAVEVGILLRGDNVA